VNLGSLEAMIAAVENIAVLFCKCSMLFSVSIFFNFFNDKCSSFKVCIVISLLA
jgi:hypothetical protein